MTQQTMIQGPLNHPLAENLTRTTARFQYRVDAAKELPEAERRAELEGAARDFEALFVTYILKVMRETIEESGLGGEGFGRSVYNELFDQELARCIADRGSFGIADLIVRRLEERQPAAGEKGDGRMNSSRPPISRPENKDSDSVAPSPDQPRSLKNEDIPDFRMPVQAPVSSDFGLRNDPFTGKRRFHRGIDIAAPEGMKVQAALGGRVIFAGYEGGYGNTVLVEHSAGYRTRYAHLGSLAVQSGDLLETEQVLGTVGSTGRSTGPHLHFEVSRYGERIDPRIAMADE
jgi:murein DD-endopeptidase MepM/ murein hydrolase activator NlpD